MSPPFDVRVENANVILIANVICIYMYIFIDVSSFHLAAAAARQGHSMTRGRSCAMLSTHLGEKGHEISD